MSVQIITSRHTVNRLSDFQLDMVLEKDGVLYMPASFVMAFYVDEWSCEDAYVASRLDGQTTNCEISGSVISVYFNSPGFPLGQLKCRVFDSVDNAAFTDGTLDTCTPLTLPVEIVATAGDSEVISLYTDGYQPPATGIPKGDLEQSVQDTLDSVANKVDKEAGKGLSTEDFTAALKTKLEALDPYTKAEVNAAIQEAVEGLGGGSVESVTINGQTKTPDSHGNVDLGTIQGQKGDKGDKGDTVVIDPEGLVQFEIANDLDTSDPTMALSARQGKILKQAISTVQANLQAVVDALANMAFTSAKPTLSQIDWTGGTFYATIVKSLTGCTATDNTNNGQIAEGQSLTMQLTADSGFTLTGAAISVTNSKGQSVAYTLNGSTLTVANVTGTINISVVAVEQVIYKGVWYEPKETGAYLHVGDDEDAIVSQLYNLGDDRESAVDITFSTTGGTSEKYGLLLFDANKNYTGFVAQSSSEVVTSVPTSVRYVRLMTGATQAVINLSYLKINGSMAFDGTGFNVSDALPSSAFMSSVSCPQPNSNGDYVGWLICKPNTPMSTDIKHDDPAIGKDVQSMLRRSVVTAIGGLETIQWVMGRKVELPSDGNTNFSAGETQLPGTALPKLFLYGSENSYYGFMTSDAGYDSNTRVRNRTIDRKFTHARIVCSLSAYNSPSPYRIFIQAVTSGEMLWSCPNNPND